MKKMIIAIFLCLCLVGNVFATTPEEFVNVYTKLGFVFTGQTNNNLVCKSPTNDVVIIYNNGGILVLFEPENSNLQIVEIALYLSYCLAQATMGKDQIFKNKNLAHKKMSRLIDTIVTNLKRNGKTVFKFDDMFVRAEITKVYGSLLVGVSLAPDM
jgi:hypothetical protein